MSEIGQEFAVFKCLYRAAKTSKSIAKTSNRSYKCHDTHNQRVALYLRHSRGSAVFFTVPLEKARKRRSPSTCERPFVYASRSIQLVSSEWRSVFYYLRWKLGS